MLPESGTFFPINQFPSKSGVPTFNPNRKWHSLSFEIRSDLNPAWLWIWLSHANQVNPMATPSELDIHFLINYAVVPFEAPQICSFFRNHTETVHPEFSTCAAFHPKTHLKELFKFWVSPVPPHYLCSVDTQLSIFFCGCKMWSQKCHRIAITTIFPLSTVVGIGHHSISRGRPLFCRTRSPFSGMHVFFPRIGSIFCKDSTQDWLFLFFSGLEFCFSGSTDHILTQWIVFSATSDFLLYSIGRIFFPESWFSWFTGLFLSCVVSFYAHRWGNSPCLGIRCVQFPSNRRGNWPNFSIRAIPQQLTWHCDFWWNPVYVQFSVKIGHILEFAKMHLILHAGMPFLHRNFCWKSPLVGIRGLRNPMSPISTTTDSRIQFFFQRHTHDILSFCSSHHDFIESQQHTISFEDIHVIVLVKCTTCHTV